MLGSSPARLCLRHVALHLFILTSGLLAPVHAPRPVRAQDQPGPSATAPNWESLAVSQPGDELLELRALSGGTLLMQGKQALWRSDDMGVSWTVAVPFSDDSLHQVFLDALDPVDLSVMYARSPEGLSKSIDGGATWARVFESKDVRRLARSPVDPGLLYLTVNRFYHDFKLLRSRDGGATWQEIYAADPNFGGPSCGWSVNILAPHRTDPAQVYWAGECTSGRTSAVDLKVSRDQGTTWSVTYELGDGSVPTRLVQVVGTNPHRMYLITGDIGTLAASRNSRATLVRSDDGGQTWEIEAQQSAGWSGINAQVRVSFPAIATYNPTPGVRWSQTWIYLAVNQTVPGGPRSSPPTTMSRIYRGQADVVGGHPFTFWESLEVGGMGRLTDLSLSIDGQYLYALAETGLWRLADPANQRVP